MSYYLQIGESGGTQFASNSGYAKFGRWVDALDAVKYVQVVHLYEYGWCQELDALAEQLKAAAEAHPPGESLQHTIDEMLTQLSARDPDAVVVTVSNGA